MDSRATDPIRQLVDDRVPIRSLMEERMAVMDGNWMPGGTPPDWDAIRALDFEGEFIRLSEWIGRIFAQWPFSPEVNGLYFGFLWPPPHDSTSLVGMFLSGSRTFDTSPDWAREAECPDDDFIDHSTLLLEMYRTVCRADNYGEERERAIVLCHFFISLVVAEWSCTAMRHVLRGDAPARGLYVGFDPWRGFQIGVLKPDRPGGSGSVIVSWSGAITDPARRASWHDSLRQVANWHECRWQNADTRRAGGWAALAAMRGAPSVPARPTLRWRDEELSGRILVDPDLCGGAESLRQEAARRNLKIEEVEIGGKCHPLLILRSLEVRGVDFRGFDLRGLYPGEDRFSFYLLESNEAPFLNGRVAAVDDRAFNRTAFMKPVADADWYARAPSVHLREFGEEWASELLAWLRWAFAPDFQFEHRDDVAFRAPRLAWQCECLEDSIGRDAAMHFGFQRLRLHFDIEAGRVERLFGGD